MSLGWGQRSRRRVRCAGRGAGSTGTPEQAGRGAAVSCRFFGLAAGTGLPLQTLARGRGRDSAVGRSRVTAPSSWAPCFLPRLLLFCSGPLQQPRGGEGRRD